MEIFSEKEISSASKGDKTTYLVSCISPCRDISINLRFTSGDADLYGRFVPLIS